MGSSLMVGGGARTVRQEVDVRQRRNKLMRLLWPGTLTMYAARQRQQTAAYIN